MAEKLRSTALRIKHTNYYSSLPRRSSDIRMLSAGHWHRSSISLKDLSHEHCDNHNRCIWGNYTYTNLLGGQKPLRKETIWCKHNPVWR